MFVCDTEMILSSVLQLRFRRGYFLVKLDFFIESESYAPVQDKEFYYKNFRI